MLQPGSDGRYSVRAVPPGAYQVAAVDGVEPGQQFDQAFLAQIALDAASATVPPGGRVTVDLRVR